MESLQDQKNHLSYISWRFVPAAVIAAGLVFDQVVNFGPVSISDLLILAVAGVIAVFTRRVEIDRKSLILFTCLSLLIAFSLLSYAKNSQLDQLKLSATLILILLLTIVITLSTTDRKSHNRILVVLAIIASILSTVNVLQGVGVVTLPPEFRRFIVTRSLPLFSQFVERRTSSIYSTFGISGIWTIIGCSTSYYGYVLYERRGKIVAASLFLLHSFNGFYILQSRNIWIALVAVSVLGLIHLAARKSKKGAMVACTSLGLTGIAVAYLQNLPRLIMSVNSNTVSKRLEQYKVSVELVAQNPLLGVGRGTVNRIVGQYLHSMILQPLTYSGILAGLIFFLLISYVFLNLFRKSLSGNILAVVYLQMFCGTFIISLTYPAYSSYSFWLVLALALSATGHVSGVSDG